MNPPTDLQEASEYDGAGAGSDVFYDGVFGNKGETKSVSSSCSQSSTSVVRDTGFSVLCPCLMVFGNCFLAVIKA